jgi:voltage-gated potassium channel
MKDKTDEMTGALGMDRSLVAMPYQILMVVISVYSVVAMAATEIKIIPDQMRQLLETVDFAVCLLFFSDFLMNLWKAPSRVRYFFTWGWLDLISSIPAIGVLRYGRLARVLRVIRVLRALKASRIITEFLLHQKKQTAVVTVGVICFSLVIFSSLSVLAFEPGMGGHIETASDALWWAVCTIATVGYGDVVPVTFEGRMIATLLMFAGVGLFATMSGLFASWLVESDDAKQKAELTRLATVVSQLQLSIDVLVKQTAAKN